MTEPEFTYFPLIAGTKEPATKWRDVKRGQYQAVGNYGIALAANQLVLDFDPRNYPVGRDLFSEFFARFKHITTRIVKTPRQGFHVYFNKPPELKLAKKQPNWPGIDFLSEGHFVIGPGTSTIESRNSAAGTYELLGNSQIAPFPQELLSELVPPVEAREAAIVVSGSLTCEADFIGVCETYAPAIENQYGNDNTYKLACIGRDLGLPVTVTYQHMRDKWNATCQPPWGDGELYEIVTHAYKHAKNSAGNRTPESVFAAVEKPVSNVVDMKAFKDDSVLTAIRPANLQLDSKGKVTDALANIVCILNADPAWKDNIKYNGFANELELTKIPPWRRDIMADDGLAISKVDLSCIQVWFSTNYLEVSETKLVAALQTVAKRYHPVKDYLESLTWDGVPRLDRILADTAGAKDTPLNRQIGKNLLIGAVQRIYEPGCQLDTVVILEGPQGTNKTKWIRTLGGDWYSSGALVRGDKDTFQNLRGRWFVELPEINATFSKHDFAWLKGIITDSVDVYRPSYERTSKRVKRQSVFVGTINPGVDGEYLKDEENRRYLPIVTTHLDIDRLARDRDQYFAEALFRYRKNEQAWISDPDMLDALKREQEKRREKDPLIDVLADWLTTQKEILPVDLYRAMGLAGDEVKAHHRKRVSAVMKELGFTHEPNFGTGGIWRKRLLTWRDVI